MVLRKIAWKTGTQEERSKKIIKIMCPEWFYIILKKLRHYEYYVVII